MTSSCIINGVIDDVIDLIVSVRVPNYFNIVASFGEAVKQEWMILVRNESEGDGVITLRTLFGEMETMTS